MTFRYATIDDLPEIVEIYNSTIPGRLSTADISPVSAESRTAWFHSHNPHNRPLWMISSEDENIGWAGFTDYKSRPGYQITSEISIYLKQQSRGRGYGDEILKYCIGQCSALGIQNIIGVIFAHNANSIGLFKNNGFKEWGHLPDVVLMDGIEYSVKILGLKINA